MKIILLSGGSGKRLWPLSNDLRSKQFLKVLSGTRGEPESMVQRIWKQLTEASLDKSVFITTGRAQVDMVHSQLSGHVPIIVEPERRDTFPAIALASVYLYSIANVDLNETVVVLPVDSYVDNCFFETVKGLDRILETSEADIALVGAKPTYPSEKYGYIIPHAEREGGESFQRVAFFKEKPQEDQAQQYIEQGALWNCGVFAFKLNYLIQMLIEKRVSIQYDELSKQYENLSKISFDYEVTEKAKHVVVASYEGDWKDLGTWNTLTEHMGSAITGHGFISHDSVGTHLVNELDIPVAVLGLSHIVVAASPDGILVTEKAASPRLKEFIQHIDQRPMYEERRWGSYRVLDYQKCNDKHEVLTKRIRIHSGKNSSYHYHLHHDEFWTILSGSGEVIIQDQLQHVKAGDVLKIPSGTLHSIRAIEHIELIEVQSGTSVTEEDTVRLTLHWAEMVQSVVY
ncbi:sugar phosphate nucleotidyltransferase [Paenibacillus xylanilyticus]|uniref:Cupin domain-containing protein n=1 Tax=Paenibacillus xylanilyticus TaxID=248903 RepID=A0A7Y6EU54_9BACL|nr:sugar phosphate nucleotidyltransferase [Paenibacillus xylanilyticus]NUU75281.1 cupin domain-containing protein [Paenibacillus xylanilyticus]